ncbi:MAG: sigma 54-interacting transcriptional regulator [Chitinispirillaceae bacterium]|nr:sigma 54-interacting transcriptional regulator [Chitinispirillaceae bacterium]
MKHVLRYFGPGTTSWFRLKNRMTLIGSSKECDIVLDDRSVHDAAVSITVTEQGCCFEVLPESKIRLNGERSRKGDLVPGDRLEIGNHIFVCDVDNGHNGSEFRHSEDKIMDMLDRFSGEIGRERDLRKLLIRLMEMLLGLLKGTDAFIFKLGEEKKPEVFVATGNSDAQDRFSDTVVQSVLESGKGVSVPNALADPAFSGAKSVADLKLSSVVCTPITVSGDTIGIIYIGSSNATVSYTAADLATLSYYATIAGMLINHVDYIRRQNKTIARFGGLTAENGIIAESKVMQEVMCAIKSLSGSDIVVLLEGPTGCGKSYLAEIIHQNSRRAGKPFLVVNCSSLHGELLESELFGHKKGSFTGAVSDHNGLFTAAAGGTLFLDEIGELDPAIQAKLLRVLESSKVRPLGATAERQIDARVICATNKDLHAMVNAGKFRSDLYYRINQFIIKIPPLAERGDDVELLAYYFLEKFKAQYPARDIVEFHPASLHHIRHYDWPGNIRELSNAIHRAVLSCDGPLLMFPRITSPQDPTFDFEAATRDFHRDLLTRAIKRAGGNKEAAARLLGMSRSTFFRYVSTLHIK